MCFKCYYSLLVFVGFGFIGIPFKSLDVIKLYRLVKEEGEDDNG